MRLPGLMLLLPLATCTGNQNAHFRTVLDCERGDQAACVEHNRAEQVRLDVGAMMIGAKLAANDEDDSLP